MYFTQNGELESFCLELLTNFPPTQGLYQLALKLISIHSNHDQSHDHFLLKRLYSLSYFITELNYLSIMTLPLINPEFSPLFKSGEKTLIH